MFLQYPVEVADTIALCSLQKPNPAKTGYLTHGLAVCALGISMHPVSLHSSVFRPPTFVFTIHAYIVCHEPYPPCTTPPFSPCAAPPRSWRHTELRHYTARTLPSHHPQHYSRLSTACRRLLLTAHPRKNLATRVIVAFATHYWMRGQGYQCQAHSRLASITSRH